MTEAATVTTVGKTCAGFVFGAAIALLAIVLIASRTHSTLRGGRSGRLPTSRRGAAASFASAVADGKWAEAERAARYVFEHGIGGRARGETRGVAVASV
jgi:hypothetical protein